MTARPLQPASPLRTARQLAPCNMNICCLDSIQWILSSLA